MNNAVLKLKILEKYLVNDFLNEKTELLSKYCILDNGAKIKNISFPYLDVKALRGQIEPVIKNEGIKINKGDFAILVDGENSGEVFQMPCDGYLGSTLKKLTFLNGVNDIYIRYFIDLNKELLKNSKTGSAIPHLNKKLFANLTLYVPSNDVQNEIVDKIEGLFVLVDRKEKNDQEKQKLKEVLKDRILDSAIHGSLIKNNNDLIKPDIQEINDEQPFLLHNNWIWVFINDITSNIQYGYTASTSDVGNARYLRITDIQNGCVNWESVPLCNISTNELSKYLLNKNDIVVARTGGTVGKNYLITDIPTTSVFASYLIRLVPNEYVDGKYLKYFMDSPLYWVQIADKSRGMAQPNVNGKSLSKLKMPLPPLEEQHRIVEKIEKCFELIEQL